MLICEKCGLSTMNARSFFPLLNSAGTYSWFCKTCIRPVIRSWRLPSDVTSLDDADLRRAMESVNVMVHNIVFNDRKHLVMVHAHLASVMSQRGAE